MENKFQSKLRASEFLFSCLSRIGEHVNMYGMHVHNVRMYTLAIEIAPAQPPAPHANIQQALYREHTRLSVRTYECV